jgi:class 3 adenylate cyclase/HAMP domain-containing protein
VQAVLFIPLKEAAAMKEWLIRLVARVPAAVHTKLLVAFLVMVVLLITLGAVGLQVLDQVNHRTEELVKLQQKIAAYRQLQLDATNQLYSVASAILVPNDSNIHIALDQLGKFGRDLDQLKSVVKEEVQLLGPTREEDYMLPRLRRDFDDLRNKMAQIVGLIRAGKVAESRDLQIDTSFLTEQLDRATRRLGDLADNDLATGIEGSHTTYETSRWMVFGFAFGSIGLAVLLGYAISLSLIGPVKRMDAQLKQIASGDFSQRVEVPNRDELGALAANLNRMSEQLGELYRQLEAQSLQLAEWNRTLEKRVADQIIELERVGRLKRFFSPQVADLVVSSGDEGFLESHRRDITVVFCDLRGFTAFSETAEPEEVMRILREFHTAMGELIFRFEGTLEHFAGDGMMVFFNDPLPCPDPSARAVRMAVAMRRRVSEQSQNWRKRGHHLGFGVGIAQGYATLGKIGFEGRIDYGAIGTVTNLASRLCDEARPGQIIISQRVYAAVEELVQAESAGDLHLKGFAKVVPAYTVMGLKESPA